MICLRSRLTDLKKSLLVLNNELKLFSSMAILLCCLLYCCGSIKSLKDAIILPKLGAEVISFLKLWLVLPASILFTIIYAKLSNRLKFETIFYLLTFTFIAFFLVFAYIIYPQKESYHLTEYMITDLSAKYSYIKWPIQIIANWSYAIMYIMSELWSVVVINLMFWQFANQIFNIQQAKIFYPILGMVGNCGLIIAGNILTNLSSSCIGSMETSINFIHNLPLENFCLSKETINNLLYSGEFAISKILLKIMEIGNLKIDDLSKLNISNLKENILHIYSCELLQSIIWTIIISNCVAVIIFRFINLLLKDKNIIKEFTTFNNKPQTKLSLKETFSLISHSKYIGLMLGLVLCYGIVINILEGPWKDKVVHLYPSTMEYLNFMGKFNISMGISSIFFTIVGGYILKRFNWLSAALVTPLIIAITGIAFFIFIIFSKNLSNSNISSDFLTLAIYVGAIQNVISKSLKYSLFDPVKEIAFIPLPKELKIKGKAAVELLGIKFGKGFASFLQSSIFIVFPMATFDIITPYLMIFFIIFICIWFIDIYKLDKEYSKISHDK